MEKNLKKIWKNESTRIWCPKIMTWKKLKSDKEEKDEEKTYVKDPEQECPRSKKKTEKAFIPTGWAMNDKSYRFWKGGLI